MKYPKLAVYIYQGQREKPDTWQDQGGQPTPRVGPDLSCSYHGDGDQGCGDHDDGELDCGYHGDVNIDCDNNDYGN